jgi:hypothetical protein
MDPVGTVAISADGIEVTPTNAVAICGRVDHGYYCLSRLGV